MEGNVSVVLKKHGELSPDETDLKPVNIFKKNHTDYKMVPSSIL
jgi:hypothetical protein